MKKLFTSSNFSHHLATVVLFISLGSYGQQYLYTFHVEHVTNPGEAKDITGALRRVFNEPTNPYETFPTFNDDRDEFQFTCPLLVTRQKVEQTLTSLGYTLIDFRSEMKSEVPDSETK